MWEIIWSAVGSKYFWYIIIAGLFLFAMYGAYISWKNGIVDQTKTEIFYNLEIEKNEKLVDLNEKLVENAKLYEITIQNMQTIQTNARDRSNRIRNTVKSNQNGEVPKSTINILTILYNEQTEEALKELATKDDK